MAPSWLQLYTTTIARPASYGFWRTNTRVDTGVPDAAWSVDASFVAVRHAENVYVWPL